ncbi:hypothetical protein H6F47_12255 [Sphaerospermopsis sp. FACHB-1094]|uniref:O-antigen ligase family protein n=1 Tax=Sphaerospermopsis sp. FACHB-1094 TaxID=2692861 RepID=UPI001681DEB6|nr:O-antigen ligase family protein [Sphaerospermopsis sp. FACHB-1094]MBD2133182.1 hypothetical protein [Sphaerospermopsis sp. FACHB-1094]
MASGIVLLISVLGAILALGNWRRGIYWLVFLTAVQDPLRKMIPDAPASVLLASVPIILGIILGLSGQKDWLHSFWRMYPNVNRSFNWFALACIPPALISLTYSANSWLMTVFGIFNYGVFLAAILVGFHFAQSLEDIQRLFSFYCLLSVVMLSGTFLEYFNVVPGWTLIGTSALDFDWVRYGTGYVVKLIAGFYRSPDVMGWHASATSILSFFLSTTSKPRQRYLWLAICVIAIAALFFCGRRKMFYMLPVAAIVFTLIYAQARGGRIFSVLPVLLIPLLIMIYIGNNLGEDSTYIRYYQDHFAVAGEDFRRNNFDALIETVRQSGFFGAGLGSASPGSQHLAIFNVQRPRTWQESGTSRMMVELGVPGFIALVLLLLSLVLSAWVQVQALFKSQIYLGVYTGGILAFFLANIGSLMVSGQILADPFITFFIAFSLGLVLSFAKYWQAFFWHQTQNITQNITIGNSEIDR